jgi:hypothetical protein
MRERDLFGGLALAADDGAGGAGREVAERAEVADGDRVVAGDLLHEGLRQRGHDHHDHAEQDGAEHDGEPAEALAEADRQDDGQHDRHEDHVVTGEEDVLQRREAREGEHHQEPEHEHVGALGPVLLLGDGRDDLVGGDDALGAGDGQDQRAQRVERPGDDGGAGSEDQEPESGLQRASHDLAGVAAQGDQADGRDDADQVGGHVEDLHADEVEYDDQPLHWDSFWVSFVGSADAERQAIDSWSFAWISATLVKLSMTTTLAGT